MTDLNERFYRSSIPRTLTRSSLGEIGPELKDESINEPKIIGTNDHKSDNFRYTVNVCLFYIWNRILFSLFKTKVDERFCKTNYDSGI